jgi:predicted Zn-dependent protease
MKNRIETLREFVALDENDAFSRYALALELVKAGHEGEATSELREVIRRDSSYVAAYYQLGGLLAKAGDVEEARDFYARGLQAARAAGDQRAISELQEAVESLDS